jgi:hypothetical protein
MTPAIAACSERNQAPLCRELERVYAALTGAPAPDTAGAPAPALDRLAEIFSLSPFERDLLLLCAGCELEGRFGEACAALHNDIRQPWPTLSLALSLLANPHWSAAAPEAPLRAWKLIEISPGAGLARSPLRISERILHYLTGVDAIDERLETLVRRIAPAAAVNPSAYRACASQLCEYWRSARSPLPVLLAATHAAAQRVVAEEAARISRAPCFAIRSSDIPSAAEERSFIARLWSREALLTGAILFIRSGDPPAAEPGRIAAFAAEASGAIAVEVREHSDFEAIEAVRFAVRAMSAAEREAVWRETLGAAAVRMNGGLRRIADYFDLDAAAIRVAGAMAREAVAKQPAADPSRLAWNECRVYARRSFEGLARRIEPRAAWDDLVLPETQKDALRHIASHVRWRALVNGEWGFAERYSRGLGVTALFAGASGTGKTMAAEVVAGELDLDLYQIDLSCVVSKYIGETEKNLRRVFEAAENSGAVLLFDEADALFGKRSEVKDSHDRYANLEISYLLQRMEAYHGLAILTTNMKQALDTAFQRRIRFVLQFPFPGPEERKRIWERAFPGRTPVGTLDYNRLAQLNVPGGLIRNIALHAAYLAADEGTGVGMDHVLRGAKVEYAKLDRPLTPAETGGWA